MQRLVSLLVFHCRVVGLEIIIRRYGAIPPRKIDPSLSLRFFPPAPKGRSVSRYSDDRYTYTYTSPWIF
jgi:hypothetical protein